MLTQIGLDMFQQARPEHLRNVLGPETQWWVKGSNTAVVHSDWSEHVSRWPKPAQRPRSIQDFVASVGVPPPSPIYRGLLAASMLVRLRECNELREALGRRVIAVITLL